MDFNLFDAAFLAFALIFTVTAFFRGFVKEVFSLFNWAVAYVISYLVAPFAVMLFTGYSNAIAVGIIVRAVLFLVILVISAMLTSGLCKELKQRIPAAFDKSLGVFYGLMKTLLVFGVIYSLIINSFSALSGKEIDENSSQYPMWLIDARSHDIVKFSGEILDPAIRMVFDSVMGNFDGKIPTPESVLDKKINDMMEDQGGSLDIPSSGYNQQDIEKMNRLIEIIDK